MGISSSVGLFVVCFLGIFMLLLREIQLLNKAIENVKRSKSRMHEKMSDKIADVEIQKIHLENKIDELEETISLWQGKSRQLNQHVNVLTNQIHKKFSDEKTKESFASKYRSAA